MTEETIERIRLETESVKPAFPARYIRFGAFQIDLRREEVFQNGQRLKIQVKVYQTLLMFVARAGEVVTREEVRQRLWSGQFQEDVDTNINTAMSKLRQALDDSPEDPSYIETIPRRGYRFLAAVEFSDSPAGSAEAPANDAGRIKTEFTWLASMLAHRHAASLVLAGMVIGALVVLAWFSVSGRSHKPDSQSKHVASDVLSGIGELHK